MGPCQTQIFEQNKVETRSGLDASTFDQPSAPASCIENYKSGLEITLQSIFPTKQEESKIQRARRILGEIATDIPDQELESDIAEFQYLIESWLDEYEKNIFDNKTLIEVLREG